MLESNGMNTMMLMSRTGDDGVKSFAMIPVSNNSPFIECIYDIKSSVLAAIGRTKKDAFHMAPRLDANGLPEMVKYPKAGENPRKQQRISQETYSEYYLHQNEVEAFVNYFAVNSESFNIKKILEFTPPVQKEEKESKLILEKK